MFGLIVLILSVFSNKFVYSAQTVKVEFECPKQCTCTDQHISDLPLMKWQGIPTDTETKHNESIIYNRVYEDDEGFLQSNPLITAAFCVFQEESHEIKAEQFFPQIEALTILYGRDTVNKVIEYELSDFDDLLALDIRGYKNFESPESADVALHHNALVNLQRLHYLNIEHVLLYSSPDTANEDPIVDQRYQQQPAYDQLERRKNELEQRRSRLNVVLESGEPIISSYEEYHRGRDLDANIDGDQDNEQRSNVTFELSNEPQIVSYDQYKKQQKLVSTFSRLSNLRFMRLYRCRLETVTWDMFKDLSNLETLSLEGNGLVDLPKLAFFSMPRLKTLVLAGNRLSYIDLESLAGLFELQHLDLSGNNFNHLSETTFAPLPALRYLDIRENPLETVYSNTFEVTNAIGTLLIASTRFALGVHANALKGLVELHELRIHGLSIQTLDANLLKGATALLHLEITDSRVPSVEFDAFADQLQLQTLVLRNCSLRFVSVDAFIALRHLNTLDLSSNQLETLSPGTFNQLDSLAELILSRNRFVELAASVLDRMQHVKMIRLEGNPWNCSCDMASWRTLNWNRVKERREVDVPCTRKYDKTSNCATVQIDSYVFNANVMPRCATPIEFKGYSVLNVLNKKLKCEMKTKKGDDVAKAPAQEVGTGLLAAQSEMATANGQRSVNLKYAKKDSKKHKIFDDPGKPVTYAPKIGEESDDAVINELQNLSQFVSAPNRLRRKKFV